MVKPVRGLDYTVLDCSEGKDLGLNALFYKSSMLKEQL